MYRQRFTSISNYHISGSTRTGCLVMLLLYCVMGCSGEDGDAFRDLVAGIELESWYKDSDGDGYSDGALITHVYQPAGHYLSADLVSVSGDCNDDESAINPGRTDMCGDGVDQDCSGTDLSCDDDDYTGTDTIVSAADPAVQYSIEVFNNADGVTTQIGSGQIPAVIEENGGLLVLDIETWPEDWEIGRVVMVRMLDETIAYKRILMRFQLADDRLAIGVQGASLLEVVSEGTLLIEGGLDTISPRSARRHDPSNRKLVNVVDLEGGATVSLLDVENLDLFRTSGGSVAVTVTCPEILLTASPQVRVEIIIDKPPGVSNIYGVAIALAESVIDVVLSVIDDFQGAILGEGNEIILTDATQDSALDVLDALLSTTAVIEKIEAILGVLNDRSRLKKLHASLEGSVDGHMKLAATVSAQYSGSHQQSLGPTILVPIAGPIPLFLSFQMVGIAEMRFDGQINAKGSVDITMPFSFRLDIVDGEFLPLEQGDMTPTVDLASPSFTGTRAGLRLSAGIKAETGLTVATILSGIIDPTAAVVFKGDATVTGDLNDGCTDMNWDVFAEVDVALVAELDLKFHQWEEGWSSPTYSLFRNEEPRGTYEGCWGEWNSWFSQYGTGEYDYGTGIAVDDHGSIYVTGASWGNLDGIANAGMMDYFVTKHDSNGTKLWTRMSGSAGSDVAYRIAIDDSGNIYVTGMSDGSIDGISSAGSSDAFVMKYDANGTKQWTRTLGTTGYDYAFGLAVDNSGNIYASGSTAGTLDGIVSMGSQDVFVVKYDSSGTKLWTRMLGSTGYDWPGDLAIDGNANIYVTGASAGALDGIASMGSQDVFVVKYDSSGTKLWTRMLGSRDDDAGMGIVVDRSGNSYITGSTAGDLGGISNAGSYDMFVAKYSSGGAKSWIRMLGSTGGDFSKGIAIDASGNSYVTGKSDGNIDGIPNAGARDAVVVKFASDGTKQWTRMLGSEGEDGGSDIASDDLGNVLVTGESGGNLDGVANAGSSDILIWKIGN